MPSNQTKPYMYIDRCICDSINLQYIYQLSVFSSCSLGQSCLYWPKHGWHLLDYCDKTQDHVLLFFHQKKEIYGQQKQLMPILFAISFENLTGFFQCSADKINSLWILIILNFQPIPKSTCSQFYHKRTEFYL